MRHTLNALDNAHDAVVDTDGIGVGALHGEEVGNLDMAAESDDLVAYGVLESKHHRHGEDHHGKSDSHTSRGYMNGRAAHLTLVALVAVYTFCYEKREVHSSVLPG